MSLRDERWQKSAARGGEAALQDPRWVKSRQAQESWKEANRDYYLAQKRRLAHRPEYLYYRRLKYRIQKNHARQMADSEDLSTNQNFHESEEREQIFRGPSDSSGREAAGAEDGAWVDPGSWEVQARIGQSGG